MKGGKIEHGFTRWRWNQRDVTSSWNEVVFHPNNTFRVRAEIPYYWTVAGGSSRINAHPTPIDREHTYERFYRSCKVSGWECGLWHFL